MEIFPPIQKLLRFHGVLPTKNGRFVKIFVNFSILFYLVNTFGTILCIFTDMAVLKLIYIIGLAIEKLFTAIVMFFFTINATEITSLVKDLQAIVEISTSCIWIESKCVQYSLDIFADIFVFRTKDISKVECNL